MLLLLLLLLLCLTMLLAGTIARRMIVIVMMMMIRLPEHGAGLAFDVLSRSFVIGTMESDLLLLLAAVAVAWYCYHRGRVAMARDGRRIMTRPNELPMPMSGCRRRRWRRAMSIRCASTGGRELR